MVYVEEPVLESVDMSFRVFGTCRGSYRVLVVAVVARRAHNLINFDIFDE